MKTAISIIQTFRDLFRNESAGDTKSINNGAGWTTNSAYQIPVHLSDVRIGDINGNGLPNFVDNHDNERKVYINDGDDTGWTLDTNYVVPAAFYSEGSMVANVNKDGLDDLFISVSTSTSEKKVYINKGDRTGWEYDSNYVGMPTFITDGIDMGARMADVTNDGYPDLVVSRSGATRKVYVNNGDGTGWSDYGFVSIPVDFVNSTGGEMGVRLMDVTGDGILDMVQAVCNAGGGNDTKGIYINDGDFSDTINYPDALTNITSARREGVEIKYQLYEIAVMAQIDIFPFVNCF